MRGNPQYRSQSLRRERQERKQNERQAERQNERQERKQNERQAERQTERQTGRQEGQQNERQTGKQTGKQEGKRDGELRRWVQRCTARFTARGDGRESAPHWNRRSQRRPTALSLRRSVIPKGFATLSWTVPPRFPSEDQMNRSESTAPQPAYTIAGSSRQRLRA